jgi:hypothetical protein
MTAYEMLTHLYKTGFKITASTILIGNSLTSLGFLFYSGTCCPIIPLTLWNISKATIYGVLWPLFVPYALGNQIFLKRDEFKLPITHTQTWTINKNGLLPHFIPLWGILLAENETYT